MEYLAFLQIVQERALELKKRFEDPKFQGGLIQRIKNRDDSLRWTMEAQAIQYNISKSEDQTEDSDDDTESNDDGVGKSDEGGGVGDCEGGTDDNVA